MILAERIAYRNPHTYTHNRLLIFQLPPLIFTILLFAFCYRDWMRNCDNWAMDSHLYQAWDAIAPADECVQVSPSLRCKSIFLYTVDNLYDGVVH